MSAGCGKISSCYQFAEDGLIIFVKLTPNASQEILSGQKISSGSTDTHDQRTRIVAKVRAVPEKGRANKALEKLLAGQLCVSKSSVRLTHGSTNRLKTVFIAGKPDELAKRIDRLINAFGSS